MAENIYISNKSYRTPKGQSRMDNPEKLVTLGTHDTWWKDTIENTEGAKYISHLKDILLHELIIFYFQKVFIYVDLFHLPNISLVRNDIVLRTN
jgi:hypothetical protein